MDYNISNIDNDEIRNNLQSLNSSFVKYDKEQLKKEQDKVKHGNMQNEHLRRKINVAEKTIATDKCRDDIRLLLNKFDNNIEMLATLSELFQVKYNNINNSIEDINDTTKNNTRRVLFENNKMNLFQNSIQYLRIIYYLVLAFWILFSNYLETKKYYSVFYWVLIIIYLLIPLKLGTIINLLYYISYNVYKFIRIFMFQTMPSSWMTSAS